jgi:hypothetical protein
MAAEATVAPTEEAPAAPAAAPEPAKKAAKGKADKKDSKAEKGGKKDKKSKKGDDDVAELSDAGPSIAAHPRAVRGVARAKSWGALVGFVLGGYLSLPTNTVAAAGLRALIAGVVCWVVAWAGAVFVWRRLVMLELKGREQQLAAATQAARARRELPAGRPERAGARAS